MDRNFAGEYTKGQNLGGGSSSLLNGRPVSYAGSSISKSQSLQMVRSASFSSPQEAETTASDSAAARRRRRLTSEETRVLCDEFEKNQKPNSKTRVKLAMQIPGMTARAIQIWFQNKRAKWKQTRRSSDAISASVVSATSPLPQKSMKSKTITKKRNSSASTSPHHSGSVSIRRYASEGELDTIKKEEEESLNAWMEEFSKTIDDPSLGLYSPTSPSSDREGSFPALDRRHLVDPNFNLANKEKKPRSHSAPDMMPSDFDAQFENLTLEHDNHFNHFNQFNHTTPGLESLEHYAANLVKAQVNEEGEMVFKLPYKIENIPPPPQMAPPGLNEYRVSKLYPNLSVHVSEEDTSQTLRKTKSVPNISMDSYRDTL